MYQKAIGSHQLKEWFGSTEKENGNGLYFECIFREVFCSMTLPIKHHCLQGTKNTEPTVGSGRSVFTGIPEPGPQPPTSQKAPTAALSPRAVNSTRRGICGLRHSIPVRLDPPQGRGEKAIKSLFYLLMWYVANLNNL